MSTSVRIINNIPRIQEALRANQGLLLRKIAEFIEGQAKLNCPVDTGNLRNSITNKVEEDSAIVGTNVAYSAYVHEGTYKQRSQPFLEDAAMQNLGQIKSMAEAELRRL